MKPSLIFTNYYYECETSILESSVPSICEMINVQNKDKQQNFLSEDEGLHIGYGKIVGCFPYKEQNQYTTNLKNSEVAVAVLENDYLKATFLTEYGGRLWELIDKKTGKNLLYTNDVIQPRNLALRNAWFSGGVEWNLGVIGHSPFTCDKLYAAETTREDGTPILRFYEFERIRKVTYQMDFWLEKDSNILFCRMRIDNRNSEIIPMYWWSNIAVPEYDHGRLVVPATTAYKNSTSGGIRKVPVPVDDEAGYDITFYGNTISSVDYFFDIPTDTKKYIANVDNDGFGLLQLSSSRLQGRKLFSWGHIEGSDNWQDVLTRDAGKYIEIQAGVAKTQYECIPMPPNTVWEWIECYTSLDVNSENIFNDYDDAVRTVDNQVEDIWKKYDLNTLVSDTKKSIGKKKFNLVQSASGYGALENKLREKQGEISISEHLEFPVNDDVKDWLNILQMNTFTDKDADIAPACFVVGNEWIDILEKSSKAEGKDNWYVWYQLGVMYKYTNKLEKALNCFKESLFLEVNKWTYHGLAYLYNEIDETNKAVKYAVKAIELGREDYSLCESCMKLILNNEFYELVIKIYEMLGETIQNNNRIKMYLAFAYVNTGCVDEADIMMNEEGGLDVVDIREGEISITELWEQIFKSKNPNVKEEDIRVPKKYNYKMKVYSDI
ncbi:DUF5107 domain-containing protein [Vallitalea sediminicola]